MRINQEFHLTIAEAFPGHLACSPWFGSFREYFGSPPLDQPPGQQDGATRAIERSQKRSLPRFSRSTRPTRPLRAPAAQASQARLASSFSRQRQERLSGFRSRLLPRTARTFISRRCPTKPRVFRITQALIDEGEGPQQNQPDRTSPRRGLARSLRLLSAAVGHRHRGSILIRRSQNSLPPPFAGRGAEPALDPGHRRRDRAGWLPLDWLPLCRSCLLTNSGVHVEKIREIGGHDAG